MEICELRSEGKLWELWMIVSSVSPLQPQALPLIPGEPWVRPYQEAGCAHTRKLGAPSHFNQGVPNIWVFFLLIITSVYKPWFVPFFITRIQDFPKFNCPFCTSPSYWLWSWLSSFYLHFPNYPNQHFHCGLSLCVQFYDYGGSAAVYILASMPGYLPCEIVSKEELYGGSGTTGVPQINARGEPGQCLALDWHLRVWPSWSRKPTPPQMLVSDAILLEVLSIIKTPEFSKNQNGHQF